CGGFIGYDGLEPDKQGLELAGEDFEPTTDAGRKLPVVGDANRANSERHTNVALGIEVLNGECEVAWRHGHQFSFAEERAIEGFELRNEGVDNRPLEPRV